MSTGTLAHAAGWGAGGLWPIVPIAWALFWFAVIGLLLRWRREHGRGGRPGSGPGPGGRFARVGGPEAAGSPTARGEQILAERYARGELSDDEYWERLSVLTESRR